VHFTLSPELQRESLAILAGKGQEAGVGLEVSVFGRIPLALSARCYHARAHGRIKDNCQFVCENDPDGMALHTMDGAPFLAINGIQTLSHDCLNLMHELHEMQDMGIRVFRLSPHDRDMVAVATLFRGVLDRELSPAEASSRLGGIVQRDQLPHEGACSPFCNGFYHGVEGYRWLAPSG
jgi:collagenase-like PrtC family protease